MTTQHFQSDLGTDNSVALEKGHMITLEHAKDTLITVKAGCLWITHDGDNRDALLFAGQSLPVQQTGKVTISARRSSDVTITPPVLPLRYRQRHPTNGKYANTHRAHRLNLVTDGPWLQI